MLLEIEKPRRLEFCSSFIFIFQENRIFCNCLIYFLKKTFIKLHLRHLYHFQDNANENFKSLDSNIRSLKVTFCSWTLVCSWRLVADFIFIAIFAIVINIFLKEIQTLKNDYGNLSQLRWKSVRNREIQHEMPFHDHDVGTVYCGHPYKNTIVENSLR